MSGNLYDLTKDHSKEIKETGLIGLKAGRYLNESIRVYGYLQANPGTEIDHRLNGYSLVKEKHDAAELGTQPGRPRAGTKTDRRDSPTDYSSRNNN